MIQVTMQEWNALTFIRHYRQQHQYSPSILEITHGCAIRNRYVAHRLLKKMGKKGLLRIGGRVGTERSIVLCRVAVAVAP